MIEFQNVSVGSNIKNINIIYLFIFFHYGQFRILNFKNQNIFLVILSQY